MHHQNRLRKGAAAVEFAIAAPLLFLTIFVVFEFGWAVIVRHTADNAAYEAARIAFVPGGSTDEAVAEAVRIMSIVGASEIEVEVNPSLITPDTDQIEVTVRGEYSQNGIGVSRFFPGVEFVSTTRLLTERPRTSS
ncbi:MAG: TadE family protein [Planctomycetota bacterium]